MSETTFETGGGRAALVAGQRGGQPAAIVTIEAGGAAAAPDLLRWAEEAATALNPAPSLLCVDDPPAGVEAALERVGFRLTVAEDELRRHTERLWPELPQGLAWSPWGEHAAPLFYHAYFESFRERPGFPGWDEAHWRAVQCGGDFRPDLSRVILDGPEPAGFAVLWIEDGLGWITQMGVRPAWRGRGLGASLLQHALTAFNEQGVETAALEVATNNPVARALYERLGFRLAASHRSWRKALSTQPR